MTHWLRGLVTLLLAASATSILACSSPADPATNNDTTTDAGNVDNGADGGTVNKDPFVNHATKHESYVPNGYQPPDATRLIVIGDSISVGVGTTKGPLSYFAQLIKNDDNTWPDEVASSLSAKFGHNVELVTVAKSGATTDDLPSQQAKLEAQGPFSGHSIVTITIGGNDMQGALASNDPNPGGDLLDNALANIGSLVDFLQDPAVFPDGNTILLMAVYDPTDGKGQANGCFLGISRPQFIPALDQWREGYINLAKEKGFGVVDALGHFHGHAANYADKTNKYYDADDNTRWFASDCIHPNDRGHSELRRLFFEAVDWSYTATP